MLRAKPGDYGFSQRLRGLQQFVGVDSVDNIRRVIHQFVSYATATVEIVGLVVPLDPECVFQRFDHSFVFPLTFTNSVSFRMEGELT